MSTARFGTDAATRRLAEATLTIVMPVFNNETTLGGVFEGLEQQEHKALVDRVLLIDDSSSDGSLRLLQSYVNRSSYAVDVIEHARNHGHAWTLNDGIRRAESDVILVMHPDIELDDPASLQKIITPLGTDSVFAAYAPLLHPVEIWRTYPFWQRCMFSRFVGRELTVFTPRFVAIWRAELETLGGFDETYRTAGEDGDLLRRAERLGWRIVAAPVSAVHVHSRSPQFGLGDWVRKEAQIAEAQGVLLRRFGVKSPKQFALSFFRELLVVGIAVPWFRRLAGLLSLAYSLLYTVDTYRRGPADRRLLVLPFVNLLLLPVALAGSLRGFVRARQTL